jgi:hypothetical protein
MSYIKNEDIRGAKNYDGRVFCADCMQDAANYKKEDLILDSDIEKADGIYYCDECGESL